MNLWLLLIPLIAVLMGLMTPRFVVWILFHPGNPVRFLGFSIQGVLPKRKQQFAEELGRLVNKEFTGSALLEQKISAPEHLEKLMPQVEEHIDHFLRHKLPQVFPMISMFIGDKTIASLKTAFMEELAALFPSLMQQYAGILRNEINFGQVVREKVKDLPVVKLEVLFKEIMVRDMRRSSIIGALFGLLIGLIQLGITLLVA